MAFFLGLRAIVDLSPNSGDRLSVFTPYFGVRHCRSLSFRTSQQSAEADICFSDTAINFKRWQMNFPYRVDQVAGLYTKRKKGTYGGSQRSKLQQQNATNKQKNRFYGKETDGEDDAALAAADQ